MEGKEKSPCRVRDTAETKSEGTYGLDCLNVTFPRNDMALLARPKSGLDASRAAAIPLWATWPLLAVVSTGSIPLFQFLAIIFAVGAAILFLFRRPAPAQSEKLVTPGFDFKASKWTAAFMISIGLFVADIFFIRAIQIIPAAQANLLNYLWPLMVVVIGVPLGLVQASKKHAFSMLLGLAGAMLEQIL